MDGIKEWGYFSEDSGEIACKISLFYVLSTGWLVLILNFCFFHEFEHSIDIDIDIWIKSVDVLIVCIYNKIAQKWWNKFI